ncbi:AsmA family protein [Acidocella aromatica]|uniref:AsmA protein n=1 Tax=Acidocella aromatica TaxID=1303579 RepID=A0A840VN44_9PROT|nr:AsmA family protein [Acidocella aromatica]MBB5372870.1 AsmA protein [Acidocella aromatica]
MSSANNETPPNRQGRPPRTRLWLLAGIGLLVALPVAAGLVAMARFNPNAYAPALIAAAERATGRQLTLGGPVKLHLSFNPTLTVSNVTLGNPAGGFAGDFVTLDKAEAQIALLPLLTHHLDILRLVLERPRITLQTLPSGASNWDFSAAPGHATGTHHFHGYQLALEAVEIRNGHVTLIPASGQVYGFGLPRVTGTAASLTAPLHLSGGAKIGMQEAQLSGVVGPIARLSNAGAGPWPVDLSLTGAGATAHLAGAIEHPRTGSGYDLTLSVDVPDLSALGALPAMRQLHLGAELSDRPGPIPAVNNLSLTAGASDLSALRPGLKLQGLDVEMASLDQPLTLQATGQLGQDPFSVKGAIGAPDTLFAPSLLPAGTATTASLPVGLSLQLGAAKAAITGAIATPSTLSGVALAINASIPDLSALSTAAGTALPAWKNITVQTTLIDPGGQGLRNAVGVDSLAVSTDHAQFGGDASLFLGAHPDLQLALKFSNLDLDALDAALPLPTPPLPTAAPSWALPLAWLHLGNADIQLAADSLVWHKLNFTALQGHATVSNGVLSLNPFTGELPGGEVSASAGIDTSKPTAAETLQLTAPALALSPLLRAFGLPDTAQGTAQLQLKAASTGDDVQTIAAGLNGSLGVAAVNGIVDGGVLSSLLSDVLKTAGLTEPQLISPGPVPVRCAALRLDAANGTGTLSALALDTPRLTLRGSGTVDFGKQTLAVTLQPQPRGQNATSAVVLGGSFTQPTLTAAPATPAPGGDLCPGALNLARLGQSGPAAPPLGSFPAPIRAAAPQPGSPANLNALLGQ